MPGNHEFYGTDIDQGLARLADRCAALGITLLAPDAIEIDGVRFIGATLWTDFLLDGVGAEPGAHRAALGISDFDGWIQHGRGTGRLTTYESVRRHRAERAFIEAELDRRRARRRDCGRHHPPRTDAALHRAAIPRKRPEPPPSPRISKGSSRGTGRACGSTGTCTTAST